MCEKRTRKIKKGSKAAQLRTFRRLQRQQRAPVASSDDSQSQSTPPSPPQPAPQMMDKALQKRVLLQLAWKTVLLMQKNTLIQQKIVALQKETREYVANVMSKPDNRRRFLDHLSRYGSKHLHPSVIFGQKDMKMENMME